MLVQLDLFDNEPKSQAQIAIEMAKEAKESGDKVRKGLFAKCNELGKSCGELERRLSLLERHICQMNHEQTI